MAGGILDALKFFKVTPIEIALSLVVPFLLDLFFRWWNPLARLRFQEYLLIFFICLVCLRAVAYIRGRFRGGKHAGGR
jgi:hypothetical protein